jgi:hypothetical protein
MGAYDTTSRIFYNQVSDGGSRINQSDADGTLFSPDTDDGFYDIGDAMQTNSSYQFAGSYEADGHVFLVFTWDANDRAIIYSPTAPVSSAGYPATYGDLPALNTGAPFPLCFAAGTLIATPGGAVAVEELAIGDAILTAEGRVVPVRFNFRQTVSTRFGPAERLRPVRVRAGALGGGLPLRDLVLTADHALLIDGLLITAGALVNGGSIDRVPLAELGESFTVYHVETEAHDVILAEGAPAESFIDYAGRQAFDNYAEYVALYGAAQVIAEQPAPRIACARLLPPALRARLGIAQAA